MNMDATISSRKNYTIKQKLDILNEIRIDEPGKTCRAIAKLHGINESVLRGWKNKKDNLLNALMDPNICTRKSRRLAGGGRQLEYNEIENKVLQWVLLRNQKGIRVKDKYIQLKALSFRNEIMAHGGNDDLKNFQASPGWVERFKKRNHLISRRFTTAKKIPDNLNEICRSFIQSFHNTVAKLNVKSENIINFDEVPRYFECEPRSTITTKGTREVLLRKSSTSHKRFTFTYAITGAGKVLKPHLLFSGLVNKPNVDNKCLVDVNRTGMWNERILINFITDAIMTRRQSAFDREPVLILFDSYGTHVKFVESEKEIQKYAKYNIHFMLIPPNMTGLLQPEDVSLNRGFQQHYATNYDKYLADALEEDNPHFRTKAGNIKSPNYSLVSKWILEWIESLSHESVQKAFKVCGLVPRDEFDIYKLHDPLRIIFEDSEFNLVEWEKSYGQLLEQNYNFFLDTCTDWHWPLNSRTSFFHCIWKASNENSKPFEIWLPECTCKVLRFIIDDAYSKELLDDADKTCLQNGESTGTNLEIFAISTLNQWTIRVTTLDEDACEVSSFNYEVASPEKNIHIVKHKEYYGLEL